MSRSWFSQRRRHALAFDAGDLDAERHDQRGVHGGRHQGPAPGEQFVADDHEAARDLVGDIASQSPPLDSARRFDGRSPRRHGATGVDADQSFRYSRSRFVCDRLTGISVPLLSFIRRM